MAEDPPICYSSDQEIPFNRNYNIMRPLSFRPDDLRALLLRYKIATLDELKQALGTRSSDFVNASLIQLQAAARLPCSGISEIALNAALAMIEAAAPSDELEGALAIQMACTHAATMSVLARFGGGHGSERRVAALGSAAARLLRAYSAQVEVFIGMGASNSFGSSMSISMAGARPLLEM